MRDMHDVPFKKRGTKLAPCVTVCAALALSGCGALGGFLGDEQDEPAPAKLESFEPVTEVRTLWSRRAASGERGQRLELRSVLAEGRVYAAGHDGDVAAYDPFTGERLWEADTGVAVSGGPGAGAGLVVVGSGGGDVIALSGADGAALWRARVTSEVLSAPAVGVRIVAVRTVDGKLFGLDAATGERIWVYDRTVPALTLRGTGSPIIAGDVVVAGFDGGQLAAVSLADGQLLWETQAAFPTGQTELERLTDMDADPVVADGIVYAVTFQGRVSAFDLSTGRTLWQRELSSHAGMGIGRRMLYITDDQSHVWAIDRRSGSSLWRQDGLARRQVTAPVEFGDYVVVADYQGHVHWLSMEDGGFAARTRAGSGAVLAPPATNETAVYVLGSTGTLTALTLP